MRCIVLTEGMNDPHGTEMLAALMLDGLVQKGWKPELFTTSYRRNYSFWTEFLSKRRIPVWHPHWQILRRYPWRQRYMAWRLWRRAQQIQAAFVFSPDNESLTSHVLLQAPKGAPPIFVHDPSEAGPACPHYTPLWFDACANVTGLSVHGQRQKTNAQRHYPNLKVPVEVVWPASFAPQRALRPPRSTPGPARFGQFGRMYSVKGALFSAAAFAQVIKQGFDAELHFFGDGPQREATEELVRSLGLESRVIFHGRYFWHQLDDLVEGIDVGLMPSVYEGFGLVMLELMSRRRPVIATDVGSSREVLEGLGGGWVVERADTSSLANAMIARIQCPDEILAKSQEARRVWESHFTPEKMMERYLLYWKQYGLKLPQWEPTN